MTQQERPVQASDDTRDDLLRQWLKAAQRNDHRTMTKIMDALYQGQKK
jgi:hypothetical protein